jgi:hypothetical protein
LKDEELTIAAPHRKFLMEGDIEMVIKKDKKPRHAWLFNDLFIICAAKGKKERYSLKKRFDIKNLSVVDMADMEGLKNAFEVRNKNTDTAGTMICVETLEMKKKWVEKLKAVLRDYQLQAVQRARKNGRKCEISSFSESQKSCCYCLNTNALNLKLFPSYTPDRHQIVLAAAACHLQRAHCTVKKHLTLMIVSDYTMKYISYSNDDGRQLK